MATAGTASSAQQSSSWMTMRTPTAGVVRCMRPTKLACTAGMRRGTSTPHSATSTSATKKTRRGSRPRSTSRPPSRDPAAMPPMNTAVTVAMAR
jgi:hypothetical protein